MEFGNVSKGKSCDPKYGGLGFTTSLKGSACDIVQTECCVFIPDETANVSSLFIHMSECPE